MVIEKKYHFYAAHRNKNAGEKCGRIHGHTYEVKCYFKFNQINEGGVTYLFSDIDKLVEPIIKDYCHWFLIYEKDPLVNILELANYNKRLFADYPIYKHISQEDSFRTSLKYLFFKIKFGIYVQIKSNKLTMFIPFNNQNFKNNWSHLIELGESKTWNTYNRDKAKDFDSILMFFACNK